MRRVLLDLTPLATQSTVRGIGRYVRGLVRGLAELGPSSDLEVLGFGTDDRVRKLELVPDAVAYAQRPVQQPLRRSGKRRDQLMMLAAPRLAAASDALLHLSEPTGFPLSGQLGHCLTCHDLIPLVLYREYISRMPGARRYRLAVERARYARARRVLAVSHASKRDLSEQLEVDAEKVDVVWHGVDHDVFHPRPGEGERGVVAELLGDSRPYLLYVGAGDPRKDLDTLVRAFARSKLAKQARLVIAGQVGPKRKAALSKLAHECGVASCVALMGYVDEPKIPMLYRGAKIHVFPSRYEGFGFPIVEALACGTPTITSPNSSLDEVAGDAALIVPCREPDALTAALERIFFDDGLQLALRDKGIARAATFTWRRCAEQTLAFWRRALED